LLGLVVLATTVVFIAASLRDVPRFFYGAKWIMLMVLALSTLAAGRTVRLAGVPVGVVFLPWFIVAVAAQIVVGATARGIGVAGGYLGLVIVSFVLLPSVFSTREALTRFTGWVLVGLVVMGLVAIGWGVRDLAGSLVGGGMRFRVRWGFEHVNTGGYIGALGLLLCVSALLHGRRLAFASATVFLLLLVTSGSRGAYLVVVVALVSAWVLYRLRTRGAGWVMLRLAVVGAGLAAASLVALASNRLDVATVNAALSGRFLAWRRALGQLRGPLDWLIGKGTGQSVNYIGTRVFVGGSSDSFVVDLLTRSGFVGLTIWLGTVFVIGVLLGWAIRRASTNNDTEWERQVCLIAGVAIATTTASLFEGFIFSVGTAYSLFTWSAVGIAALATPSLAVTPASKLGNPS
jgi:hypothetical protein